MVRLRRECLEKWVRGECIRGTLNTHFRGVKSSILCESLGRRGRRLHTESTTSVNKCRNRSHRELGVKRRFSGRGKVVVGWILVTLEETGCRGSCERRHGVGVNNGVKRGSEEDCYLNPPAIDCSSDGQTALARGEAI